MRKENEEKKDKKVRKKKKGTLGTLHLLQHIGRRFRATDIKQAIPHSFDSITSRFSRFLDVTHIIENLLAAPLLSLAVSFGCRFRCVLFFTAPL